MAAPRGKAPPRTEAAPPLVTPDGRYLVVRGRLWRRTRPDLDPAAREPFDASHDVNILVELGARRDPHHGHVVLLEDI